MTRLRGHPALQVTLRWNTARTLLSDLQNLRNVADYTSVLVAEIEATRALRRARRFVEAIRQEGSATQ